jgi:hypothetical protein
MDLAAPAGARYPVARLRGCGEGWANHFSVQTRKESMSFVGGSHVAELIQHQKVIDYTPTIQWLPQPSSAFFANFGLLRAIHAATLHHTAKRRLDHTQQPTVRL